MTFFNTGTGPAGEAVLTVLPQWWYYPVATIPLTILVFSFWMIWQRQRENRKSGKPANFNMDIRNLE